jgi:YesN/AraC family two-component response regulator
MNEVDKIYKILIVDDDEDILDAMQLILKNADQFESEITTVLDSKSAIAEIEKQEYDLVLSDFKMPGMNGIDLLTRVKDKHPKTSRILITGYPSIEVVKDAINKANVHYYIEKPWDNDELKFTIYNVLKREQDIKTIKTPLLNNIKPSIIRQLLKEPSEKSVFDNLDPPPKKEPEKDLGEIIGVDNANEALKLLAGFEKKISTYTSKRSPKQTLMLEFTSVSEFNKFSFDIEKRENTRIKDVRIFENKYIISVSIYPSTYHFVS